MSRFLVIAEDGAAGWSAPLADPVHVSPATARPALAEAAEHAEAAFVDGALADPLAEVRRLNAADAAVQAVLVAGDGRRAELERALLFAPGLGEVWIVAPAQVDAELAERAAVVTAQRRRYRGMERAVRRGMPSLEPRRDPRALISDAFLAALLEVLPDPVASLDEAGAVLSWNPAAERVTGWPRHEAEGRAIADVLRVEPPDALARLLIDGRSAETRGEIAFLRRSGERGVAEVAVVPVVAAGHEVRALVLHDVTALRETQSELEAQASELQAQAAELEMLNVDLAERTGELERAMSTRSRFYAAMSHELRTPINAVIGYNQLILDGIFGDVDARQRDALVRSQKAAGHLLELVNDVLDLSKIEAGRIELEIGETDVPGLLRDLMDTVRPLAEEHETPLEWGEGDPPCGPVRTDPRRLRQIVLNLLSNAIKFGGGQPVSVTCRGGAGGGVDVVIRDRGVGIAPADRDRIFEEFVQIDRASGTGTGLGLPISQRLAVLLGGRISLESEEGEGSTFTVHLPPDPPSRPGRLPAPP